MKVTLEQVKQDIASGKSKMIYYSTKTVWWTHLSEDLKSATKKGKKAMSAILKREVNKTKEPGKKKMLKAHLQSLKDSPIPLDPTGAPLYQLDNVQEWIEKAEENPKHFGQFGLDAFMMGHHQNAKGFCPTSWKAMETEMIGKGFKQPKN